MQCGPPLLESCLSGGAREGCRRQVSSGRPAPSSEHQSERARARWQSRSGVGKVIHYSSLSRSWSDSCKVLEVVARAGLPSFRH